MQYSYMATVKYIIYILISLYLINSAIVKFTPISWFRDQETNTLFANCINIINNTNTSKAILIGTSLARQLLPERLYLDSQNITLINCGDGVKYFGSDNFVYRLLVLKKFNIHSKILLIAISDQDFIDEDAIHYDLFETQKILSLSDKIHAYLKIRHWNTNVYDALKRDLIFWLFPATRFSTEFKNELFKLNPNGKTPIHYAYGDAVWNKDTLQSDEISITARIKATKDFGNFDLVDSEAKLISPLVVYILMPMNKKYIQDMGEKRKIPLVSMQKFIANKNVIDLRGTVSEDGFVDGYHLNNVGRKEVWPKLHYLLNQYIQLTKK